MNVEGVFPRRTGYLWALMRARTEGSKPRRDGMKDATGGPTPSVTRVLENSVVRFLCDGEFRANVSVTCRLFKLLLIDAYFSTCFPFQLFVHHAGRSPFSYPLGGTSKPPLPLGPARARSS